MGLGHHPSPSPASPLPLSNGQIRGVYPPGPLANRPAAGWTNTGWYYLATDQNGGTFYLSIGTAWIQVAQPVNLPATGVGAGSYGDSTHYPTFTVGADGRLTVAGTQAANAGTVTSVGLQVDTTTFLSNYLSVSSSPVTSAGTIILSAVAQNNNAFLSGPNGGGPASPTFRSIAPGDLTNALFVAAGASHKIGAAPDPGATAHTHFPYSLLDNATWALALHLAAAPNVVSTDESTTSNTFVDLTTVDSITFSLDVTTNCLALYFANTYNTVVNDYCSNEIFWDGTGDAASRQDVYENLASGGFFMGCASYKTSLAAGSHTVKCQHLVGAGTGHWRSRILLLFLSP